MSITTKSFEAAVNVIRALPKEGPIYVSIARQLKFYSLFKVATQGRNNTPKPSIWCIVERIKWNNWTDIEDMDPEEAKRLYVEEFAEMIKEVHQSGNLEDYIRDSDLSFVKNITLKDLETLEDYARDKSKLNSQDAKLFSALMIFKEKYHDIYSRAQK